jgi:membrane-bound lytic murein transglycosylase D
MDDIAAARRTTRGMIASLNGMRAGELLRPGTVLFVPAQGSADPPAAARPFVVVPAQVFSYADRQRVFYRVVSGDSLRELSAVFGVSVDDLCRWNALDSGAALHDGMTLQIFAQKGKLPDSALVLADKDAQVLHVGSQEFFAHFESLRGRKRVELLAKQGDTWRSLGHKYGLSVAQMERINGRARSTPLAPGEKVVVYVPAARAVDAAVLAPKPEDRPPEEVAVAKPLEEDSKDKDDGAVKPAALKPGETADGDKPATPPTL